MVRRKRLILAVMACGAAIALVFAFGSKPTEPSYKEKTLTQWINIYWWPDNPAATGFSPRTTFLDPREARRNEAAAAVRQIGTNAIPTLLKWSDKDYPVVWKHKLWDALPKSLQNSRSVGWWLVAGDHYRVGRALTGFYLLGSNATPVVPELTRRMMTRDSASGVTAADILGNMGGHGLPSLLSGLTNTRTPNRVMVARSAIRAISGASNDISGLMVLAQCVQDADPYVGSTAAEGLGFITNHPDITIPALITGLEVSRQVRSRSAEALGKYGAEARSAVPALLQYQDDPDAQVRQSVSNALRKIMP